ncbi:Cytochrome c, mono-and diheme variants [Nitrosospira multiformis]|uniref:Cytochrome c, mono-and diheme variants n=1 Tax=Nitrosospira multiformis TaxID=1231 RepID=A0A1I0FW25_9PROT|nr:Cytochrome c, mono-and diheme variants [Nitrosospira multiformis]
MSPLLFTGLLALAFPAPSFAANPDKVEFKKEGKVVRTFSVDRLRAITREQALKVFEPHERRNRVYRVLPARAVFAEVFGRDWEKAHEIVFTAIDGYQPSVPVKKFLHHDGYFGFANEDREPFTLTNKLQNNEVVPLGPLYLVWNNIDSKELLEAGASDMPYQIKTIELKMKGAFPNMIPPSGSSEQVQRGFEHFRRHCAACHTINGDGGGKAPELNYPESIVEYIKPEYLKRWILAPQTIRYNTMMPGLGEEISNREQVAAEIIAYLKTMSGSKRAPSENPADISR